MKTERRRLPRSLDDVVGQDRAVRQIRLRVQNENHSRPLALVGPTGIGKRTLAALYAQILVCEERAYGSSEPCGCCGGCKGFIDGSSIDFAEFDLSDCNALTNVRYKFGQLSRNLFNHHRVYVIKNLENAVESADAMLKTIEKGARQTTFILLIEDRLNVRAPVMSRATECVLVNLRELDVHRLIKRWYPQASIGRDVLDLMVACGRGRPGLISKSCDVGKIGSSLSLSEAQSNLGLLWGGWALRFWSEMLGREPPDPSVLEPPIGTHPVEALRYVRAGLIELSNPAVSPQPAFIGQDDCVIDLNAKLHRQASCSGISANALLLKLNEHWLEDAVIDKASLFDWSMRSRLIVMGSL